MDDEAGEQSQRQRVAAVRQAGLFDLRACARDALVFEEGHGVVAAQLFKRLVAAAGDDTFARTFEVAGKQTAGQQHAASERQCDGGAQEVGDGGIDAGAMRNIASRLVALIGGVHSRVRPQLAFQPVEHDQQAALAEQRQ